MATPFDNITVEDVIDDESEEGSEGDPTEEKLEDSQENQDDERTGTSEGDEGGDKKDEQEEEEGTGEEGQSDVSEDEVGDDEGNDEESTEGDQEEVSVIGALQEKVGIDTNREYSEDLDGAAQFVMDAANEVAQSQLDRAFEQYPEVQRFMEFRSNGGDPEDYFEVYGRSSWSEVELAEDNQSQHERIVQNRLQEEGYDNDEIEDAIEDYKQSGILETEAKRSLRRLRKLEEEEKEELVQQQKKQAQDQQDQIEELWNDIEETVQESNDLKGLPLPEAQKSEFFSYMNEPVDEIDGQPISQRDIDAQNASLEDHLALDYLLYMMNQEGFSLSSIIDSEAQSKKANDLKKLLDGSNSKDTPSDKSGGLPSGGSDGDDVDTESIPDVQELIGA